MGEDPLNLGNIQLITQDNPELRFFLPRLQRHPELLNLYAYVGNNPLVLTDPLGLAGIGGTPIKGIVAGGPGELVGGIAGSIIGAGLGLATGVPGLGIVGGMIGGQIGGTLGGLFDPPCSGQLNCDEPPPPPPPKCQP